MSGRKLQLTASENVMQEAASVLAQFKTWRTEVPVTVPVKEDDDDDIFGKPVASEMRKVKNPRAKGLARVRIQSVLWQPEPLNRNESGRFGALKSDSTHHFFRNACTKSGSLRFSQFSGCWLILSVYIIMSFDFPFVRLFGVR